MNRDKLKELGLSDEQINNVMAMHGAKIEDNKAELEKLEAIKAENETLKTQLADRDKDITSLKDEAKDNEALSTQLTELQSKYETANKELETTKFDGALSNALTGADVRNVKATRALLDLDKVSFDDKGQLSGLDEQIKALKESDAYLFKTEPGAPKTPYTPAGGDNPSDIPDAQELINAWKSDMPGVNATPTQKD